MHYILLSRTTRAMVASSVFFLPFHVLHAEITGLDKMTIATIDAVKQAVIDLARGAE